MIQYNIIAEYSKLYNQWIYIVTANGHEADRSTNIQEMIDLLKRLRINQYK